MAHRFDSTQFRYESDSPSPLDRALKAHFGSASWGAIRNLIDTGKVSIEGVVATDRRVDVQPRALVAVQMTAPRRKPGTQHRDGELLYCDPHLVVADKPIGISSIDHPREATSFQSDLRDRISRNDNRRCPALHIVHRLDKVTSGVMIFARSKTVQVQLKEQFRAHTTGRLYWAVAHGTVRDATLRYHLVRDRGDGIRGVTRAPGKGQHSVTHVTAKEPFSRCTLVECKLETGRTHQIRIHLAEIGHPVVGDPVYARGFRGPPIACQRTLLHAAYLSFTHPVFRTRLEFAQPLPDDFEQFLRQERGQ